MPAAPTIIDRQLKTIHQLCHENQVARLELFGSAADGTFDLANSDVDFLVEFQPLSPADRADAYFSLLAELQDLFQRDIDLVESEAITNPYFKQLVDAQRTVLYAA